MKCSKPDEGGVVRVQGILVDRLSDAHVVPPSCECCGSRRDWSLFWLPDEWRGHTVVVTVRLATAEEINK